jgi:cupin fold WbuC family metalloprotein
MKIIDNECIVALGKEAAQSSRKRINFNLHETPDDTLQRMIHVLQPGTYLCPHMHKAPLKREVFVIVRGSLLVCIFDKNGNIEHHVLLDHASGNFLIEIPAATYHTIIPLAVNTCVFECKDGPYNPDTDKIFAPWAPMEGEQGALEFNKQLLKQLDYMFPEFF